LNKLTVYQRRVLLVALLPVLLLAVILSTVFVSKQLNDATQAQVQYESQLVQEVAARSEYGLFSGNFEELRQVLKRFLRQPGVVALQIVDANGDVVVREANEDSRRRVLQAGSVELLSAEVIPSEVELDPSNTEIKTPKSVPPALGKVVMQFSRESLIRQSRGILLIGSATALGGLALGILLALRLSRQIVQPVQRISTMVQAIGEGDLSARISPPIDDPLIELQMGLNRMALQLQENQARLQEKIEQATQELQLKKDEAEAATAAKSRFIAAASHDLRQPTHALGLFVSRLQQLPQNHLNLAIIQDLEQSVQAMQDMLDALLDLSRLETGTVVPHIQPVELAPLLRELEPHLTAEAKAKGLLFSIRPANHWVNTDPLLLRQMLVNLMTNAIRYTPKGRVLVACRSQAQGSSVRLQVWDTGIGISPADQQEIFSEYFQVANPERTRAKGLGLGLWIVKSTAALLGHRLSVRSVPGRGSCFSIELPCVRAVSNLELRAPDRDTKIPGGMKELRVLLLEDDELVAKASTELMHDWGCEVIWRKDLAQALAWLAQAERPDLLISDVRLPGPEDGLMAVQRMRQACEREVPALLISGETDPDLMNRAQQAGLTLLLKPLRPAKLRALISRIRTTNA